MKQFSDTKVSVLGQGISTAENGLFIFKKLKTKQNSNKQKLPRRGKTRQLASRFGKPRQSRAEQSRAGQDTTKVTSMTNWHRIANTRKIIKAANEEGNKINTGGAHGTQKTKTKSHVLTQNKTQAHGQQNINHQLCAKQDTNTQLMRVFEPQHETETQDMSAGIRTPRSNMKQGMQTREHTTRARSKPHAHVKSGHDGSVRALSQNP